MHLTRKNQRNIDNTVRYVTNVTNERMLLEMSSLDDEVIKEKRKEIRTLAEKYSIGESFVSKFLKYYVVNKKLELGTVTKSIDFLSYILRGLYGYSDEEVSEFINKNAAIMRSSYGDFRTRLAIFNHLGMLDDVIFKGYAYLGADFTSAHFGTRSLYAVIKRRNVTNLEELATAVSMTAEKDLASLRGEFPLTSEMIHMMDEELQKKIRKESFKRELERRKSKSNI